MAITYEWKITALKKAPSLDGLSDVITHINFDYIGTDDDTKKTSTFAGACPVGAPDKDNFTALKDLEEDDIIEWAKANHPVENMQEVIEKDIAQQITPTNVEVDLPWVPPVPEKEEESEEEESSEE